MTKFPKSELREVTNIYLLANTPKSLFGALVKTNVVDRLRRECSNAELLNYYKKITAKGRRTPFVVAMAYASLIALLLNTPVKEEYPDTSFLQWGQFLEDYANKKFGSTQTLIISPHAPKPTTRLVSAAGNPLQTPIETTKKSFTQYNV